MKNIKFSVAALLCCGLTTSALAGNSLGDAFANGKVTGELKAYYFSLDVDQPSRSFALDASIFATGIKLGYKTDSFHGIQLGTTFQTNNSPFVDSDAKTQFGGDMYGPGAVLSEGYLEYNAKKTNVKVGRQGIGAITPLVRGSRSRIIEESFEGVMFVNRDISDTLLTGGHISKFQARNTYAGGVESSKEDSTIPTFEKQIVLSNPLYIIGAVPFDGAYTVGAVNKSVTNTVLVGNYVKVNDVESTANSAIVKGDIDIYFAEALHTIPMDGYKIGLDAMYVGSKLGSTLNAIDLNGYYYGLRASLKDLGGIGVQFAYGTTSKDDGVIASIGNGGFVYTGTKIGGPINQIAKDTDSFVIGLSYNFNNGLKSEIMYGASDHDSTDSKSNSKVLTASYNPPSVKALSFELDYETMYQETSSVKTNQRDEMRFKTKYRF